MATRKRAVSANDDMIVCQRMGYSSITPQACVEKHVKNEEACGGCRLFRNAAMQMADAVDGSVEQIVKLALHGEISRFGNPVVTSESLPDQNAVTEEEKGKKIMNTRILYVNGKRIPQGVITDFQQGGGLAERSLVVFFMSSFFVDAKIEARDIAVDEYLNGRLMTRYEWSSSDEKTFGPAIPRKMKKATEEIDVVGYRMQPIVSDNFTRG